MHALFSPGKVLRLALAFSGLCAVASADSFTSVVAYGDSLSDNGNLFAASGFPPPPYFKGRRSNGPVAVEQLAAALGVPLVDFAWDGATTGLGNLADGGTPTNLGIKSAPGMQVELANSAASLGPFANNGLFIVWGGADDFLAPSPLDATPQDVINRAVGDLLGIVTDLQLLGVKHILVPGIPDLGLSPFFAGQGPVVSAQLSAITDIFNAQLQAGLPSGVLFYDTSALVRSMVADPAAFGFTNVTAPCFDGANVCANPDQYLFWDDFHPTTAADAFAARGFEDTAVPEPASMVLLLTAGVLCLGAQKRRRVTR